MTAHPAFTRNDLAALRSANHDKAIREIAGKAAATAGMTLARVLGPDRTTAANRVRDAICFVAVRQGYNFEQIAQVLRRDPTTISAAYRRECARRSQP